MLRVGIIVRHKKTDALICQALARHFQVTIVQYGVPNSHWLSWILKRLRTAGFWTLVGHLELSACIKLQQYAEIVFGKTVWERCGIPSPEWTGLVRHVCKSEQSLHDRLAHVDLIIALDAFRLSQSFLRASHIPYFEIVWGDATKYLGDSAAFWQYISEQQAACTVSIVLRSAYFQKVSLISQIPVPDIHAKETLRTLKVKQAIETSRKLPDILLQEWPSAHHPSSSIEQRKTVYQCYAPTLLTYVGYAWFNRRVIPRYACRPKEILLTIPTRRI